MIRVVIESPLAGDVERNQRYLRRAIRDCLQRGETPYASHQMLVGALDDDNPEERELGIRAGFGWRESAAMTVFYVDHGFSRGMIAGLEHAIEIGHAIAVRRIGEEP